MKKPRGVKREYKTNGEACLPAGTVAPAGRQASPFISDGQKLSKIRTGADGESGEGKALAARQIHKI